MADPTSERIIGISYLDLGDSMADTGYSAKDTCSIYFQISWSTLE